MFGINVSHLMKLIYEWLLLLLLGKFLLDILYFDWHFLVASSHEKDRNTCRQQHMPFWVLNCIFIRKNQMIHNILCCHLKAASDMKHFHACNIFCSLRLNLAFSHYFKKYKEVKIYFFN